MLKKDAGQALILVLLSLSVVLAVVLYIISRSVTDVAISSTQEESVRAFSAAEAGIEKALIAGSGSSQNIGDSSYVSNVSDFATGQHSFNYPIPLSIGDSATFWLASHDTNGNLTATGNYSSITVCWGDTTNAPAIEVSIFYESTPGNPLTTPAYLATIKIARAAFDPNAVANGNYFTSVSPSNCTISGQTYAYMQTIAVPTGSVFAKVRMLYNTNAPQNVGIILPSGTLPSQGQIITSTGTSNVLNGAGGSNRKISVFSGWPEFPFTSDAVFSPINIDK